MIDELERQYDSLQVEIDKLLLSNKRKRHLRQMMKKREQYKRFQAGAEHVAWSGLAKLLANEELDPKMLKRAGRYKLLH
ncbi:AVN_HP_G0119990.mRNA.1.CDS.1 [Saccharomyces cerevisiae]|nr:AVN_HP_G0119990.mRNA.1.CDS.1 [Saccharomyces cerevisiae]CAI6997088.1 AVN_HP_G0119990.mRNA.1.CDS.1 [Saccharomyces cerevisiae]